MADTVKYVLMHPNAQAPCRAHTTDAGFDLFNVEHVTIQPGGFTLVNTGIAIAIPDGYYGRVASRSSLAVKFHVEVGAGVIDAGYRGELKVKLCNHGHSVVVLAAGNRIAQLIVTPIFTGGMQQVQRFEGDTDRGTGGFGSTNTDAFLCPI